VSATADWYEVSNADARRVLAALDEVVLEEIGNPQKVRIGGLVQLTPRVKPATKKRQGRNPATGEEITIAAEPTSVDLPPGRSRRPRAHCRRCRTRAAAYRLSTERSCYL
jgi:nucleoid DNA-binding protein